VIGRVSFASGELSGWKVAFATGGATRKTQNEIGCRFYGGYVCMQLIYLLLTGGSNLTSRATRAQEGQI